MSKQIAIGVNGTLRVEIDMPPIRFTFSDCVPSDDKMNCRSDMDVRVVDGGHYTFSGRGSVSITEKSEHEQIQSKPWSFADLLLVILAIIIAISAILFDRKIVRLGGNQG
jgi:hypothetical protein